MKGMEIAETKQEDWHRKYGNRANKVQSQSAFLWVPCQENSVLNAACKWKIFWSQWILDQSHCHSKNSDF